MPKIVVAVVSVMISATFGLLLAYMLFSGKYYEAEEELTQRTTQLATLQTENENLRSSLDDSRTDLEARRTERDAAQHKLHEVSRDLETCIADRAESNNEVQRISGDLEQCRSETRTARLEAAPHYTNADQRTDRDSNASIEWTLASIQTGGTPNRRTAREYKKVLNNIAENCPENTRQQIADMTTKAWQILRGKGIAIDLLSVMRELETSCAGSICRGNNDFASIAAVWLTLAESLYGGR